MRACRGCSVPGCARNAAGLSAAAVGLQVLLQHLPATTVGMVAMLEPVLGALVAYLWLDESLAAQQLLGGAIVLAAIFLAQSAR